MNPRYTIEPLAARHDRAPFDCGEPGLNDFLKRYARQNDARGLGRTFVAVLPENPRVYGYYTSNSHFEKGLLHKRELAPACATVISSNGEYLA